MDVVPSLSWDEQRYALGHADMDLRHQEFLAQASVLATCTDAEFPAAFEGFVEHTREHFGNEDALMKASRFPALGEHLGEHQRVLGELRIFQRSVTQGRLKMARAYVRDSLPEWFALHLSTMDSALAAHLKRQG